MEDQKSYRLSLSCWRGTVMTRDFAQPEYYETRDQAIKRFDGFKQDMAEIGWEPYACDLTYLPTGEREELR